MNSLDNLHFVHVGIEEIEREENDHTDVQEEAPDL